MIPESLKNMLKAYRVPAEKEESFMQTVSVNRGGVYGVESLDSKRAQALKFLGERWIMHPKSTYRLDPDPTVLPKYLHQVAKKDPMVLFRTGVLKNA